MTSAYAPHPYAANALYAVPIWPALAIDAYRTSRGGDRVRTTGTDTPNARSARPSAETKHARCGRATALHDPPDV